jgi:tetratricopeptide (TPR) repeat protein
MNESRNVLARLTTTDIVRLSALLAIVAYLPGIFDGFVFDDLLLIAENPYAHELRYLGRCFTTDLWDTPARAVRDASTLFYRPLVCASYILNWKLGFGRAWAFHAVNIAAHAGTCALAARVARRWTRSNLAALLAAALFALHPSRSENVTWISGRTDILMALAFLGADELAVLAARQRRATRTWIFALLAWVASLLCKEFAIFAPLWLVVEAALQDERKQQGAKRRLLIAGAVTLGVSLVYLGLRAAFLPINPPELATMALPLPLHVGYVLLSIGYYVERLVFPWPQTFFFRPVVIDGGTPSLFVPSLVLGLLVAVAYVIWTIRAYRRDHVAALILVVTGLVFLPILNVTYTGFRSPTQDRFVYLPLFLLALGAARFVRGPLARWTDRSRIAPLLLGAFTLVLAAVNWVRSLDYANEESLWRHELEVNADNPHALNSLARVLSVEGDTEAAEALLRRALTPAALRYRLVANPTNTYIGLLALQGSRLADGNVGALTALLLHVVDLVRGAPLEDRGSAGDLKLTPPVQDEYFRIHVANGASYLAASGALVASRIGRDDLVRLLVASLDEKAQVDPASRYNLALSLGRGGDYSGARRQLATLDGLSGGRDFGQAVASFNATLEAVKDERLRAHSQVEPAKSLSRARAFLELGAYLRAARTLRDLYQIAPDDPSVQATYFDALVSARLETDARTVAERAVGPERAKAKLDEAEHHLSARTAHAIPPPPHERWWLRPPGVREE